MNQNHEEIIKNLKDKEKSKDEYNTLDTDITEYQIRNTTLKLKLRKAVQTVLKRVYQTHQHRHFSPIMV
jgi:hypothetical protein